MKKRILGVAFAAALALAGCGGGGDSNNTAGGDSVDLGSAKAYQAADQSHHRMVLGGQRLWRWRHRSGHHGQLQ